MSKISQLPSESRAEMANASYALASQFTPESWAKLVWERGMELARVFRKAA
jgi:hypothetical protein